jgi:hypothetical protein
MPRHPSPKLLSPAPHALFLVFSTESNGDEVITRAKTAPAGTAGEDAKLEVDAKASSPAVGRSQSAPLPPCDKV